MNTAMVYHIILPQALNPLHFRQRNRNEHSPAFLVLLKTVRDGLPLLFVVGKVSADGGYHGIVPVSEPKAGDDGVFAGKRVWQSQAKRDDSLFIYRCHTALTACRFIFGSQNEELAVAGCVPVRQPFLVRGRPVFLQMKLSTKQFFEQKQRRTTPSLLSD